MSVKIKQICVSKSSLKHLLQGAWQFSQIFHQRNYKIVGSFVTDWIFLSSQTVSQNFKRKLFKIIFNINTCLFHIFAMFVKCVYQTAPGVIACSMENWEFPNIYLNKLNNFVFSWLMGILIKIIYSRNTSDSNTY